MGGRKPIHYVGGVLILFAIAVATSIGVLGIGRAAGSNATRSLSNTDGAFSAPGVNAFSNGKRENLDFAFYEEFLRNRSQNADGFIADKTGEWSKGSPNTIRQAGETPDLQRVSQQETIFAKQSPVHNGGPIGATGSGSLPTGDLFGVAFFSGTSVGLPGLLPGGFGPDVTPPVSEIPVPPPAILFVSAIAGFAFARRSNKG